MATATIDRPTNADAPTFKDRAVEAYRQAAHVSHEARLLKSLAADAVEDGVYTAKRTMKTVRRRIGDAVDMRDDLAHRIKQEPFRAVGVAFAAGLCLGAIVMLFRRGHRRDVWPEECV